MAIGDLRKKLLEKVKAGEQEKQDQEETPIQIKNTNPGNFSRTPAWYHAQDTQKKSEHFSGRPFPKESVMNKSVHERMKDYIKTNNGKKTI